jgi:hypothetical protein
VSAKHAASIAYVRLSDHDVADRYAVRTSTELLDRMVWVAKFEVEVIEKA